MTRLTPLLLIFVPLACTSPENQPSNDSKNELTVRGKRANLEKAEDYDLISVSIGTGIEQVPVSEQHLHGRFYHDRAAYYVIENPELYLSNAEVQELTLYFIDGTLCKKKYKLGKDISTELIKSYGGFKFIPRNHRTRDLAKSEKIVFKTTEGNILNEKLERFEMKWDQEDILIRYHLEKDSLTTEVLLMEELTAYKSILTMAGQEVDEVI